MGDTFLSSGCVKSGIGCAESEVMSLPASLSPSSTAHHTASIHKCSIWGPDRPREGQTSQSLLWLSSLSFAGPSNGAHSRCRSPHAAQTPRLSVKLLCLIIESWHFAFCTAVGAAYNTARLWSIIKVNCKHRSISWKMATMLKTG